MSKHCDNCGKPHDRKRFCSNSCKDHWHNKHNPRGYMAADSSNHEEDDEKSEIEEMAGSGYAAGWDEDGWLQ